MYALLTLLAQEGSHVWHFWLGVLLAPPIFLAVIAIFVLYAFKVSRTRYPEN
ncbi:MAG: hypothetical protein M9952_00510 [Microthrixaceae bacterium]|nr:hypothetical protein [Microthrixaceae bacterium]MCO5311414.1 hypothetical protein [Microthrixaceae bacterium]HPB44749.1 hypothetical protein [Microthrixaceae bacterium]